MSGGETELAVLLRTMKPRRHDIAYEFVPVGDPTPGDIADALAIVREEEGVTLVRPCRPEQTDAMACITLTVHSSLHAVGLTAAVSAALADCGISCNVVAGFHHDHLFVPWSRSDEAIAALSALSGGE